MTEQGVYHYLLNGATTEVEEHWVCHGDLGVGRCRVESSRRAPGVEIAVKGNLDGLVVQDFEIHWSGWDTESLLARYARQGDEVTFELFRDGALLEPRRPVGGEEGCLPILYPLMRIFTGPLLLTMLERGGEVELVLPSIADPRDEKRLLRPETSLRAARLISESEVLTFAGEEHHCRRLAFTGGLYGHDTPFWVDHRNRLVRYQWDQAPGQSWDIWLESQS